MTDRGSPAWLERCQTRWSAPPADAPLLVVRNRWQNNFKLGSINTIRSICSWTEDCTQAWVEQNAVFYISDGALQAWLASLQLETKDFGDATRHSWGVWKEDWSWWGNQSPAHWTRAIVKFVTLWFSFIASQETCRVSRARSQIQKTTTRIVRVEEKAAMSQALIITAQWKTVYLLAGITTRCFSRTQPDNIYLCTAASYRDRWGSAGTVCDV